MIKPMDPAAPPSSVPWILPRPEAIRRLRDHLVKLTDDDHSICEVAASKGIFCGGFKRWTDAELKEHFAGLLKRRPNLTRAQLEELANTWELARQIVDNVNFACDVQTLEHDTCTGWDEFTNEQLARFCVDLLGLNVSVEGEGGPKPAAGPPLPARA